MSLHSGISHLIYAAVLLILPGILPNPVQALQEEDSTPFTGGILGAGDFDSQPDEIPGYMRKAIEKAIARYEREGLALPVPKDTPLIYPFFPQAGIFGQDLFMNNYADLDPSSGIVDWDCTDYTYNGHRGHDSGIRSFREQAIGVPIFAALDGRVVDSHDGEFDMNTEFSDAPANYVVLDHGGGYYALYWHMKRGSVAVKPNQTVSAGTQIGLTGSSGFSTGPHLHFESLKDEKWFEPFAGPCRSGASSWKSQLPVTRNFYVGDTYLSPAQIPNDSWLAVLQDSAPRASTFVAGPRSVYMRLDFHNLTIGSNWRLRLVSPANVTTIDIPGVWGNPIHWRVAWGTFVASGNFTPGQWRMLLDINGKTAVNAPFTIVPNASQVKNRPPKAIKARLLPTAPVTGQIMTCSVQTSLLFEDPDYDLIRYKYIWKVNGRAVRTVTSAALTDILAKGKTKKGDKVTCSVTPSDGRASGPTATVSSR